MNRFTLLIILVIFSIFQVTFGKRRKEGRIENKKKAISQWGVVQEEDNCLEEDYPCESSFECCCPYYCLNDGEGTYCSYL